LKVGPRPIKSWSWADFIRLPITKVTRDIHCVTKWSKYDTGWEGVSIADLLADAELEPPTEYTLAHSYDGYSTNVPTADLTGARAMIAISFDGKPLEAEHGGPARLLVPHLYFWKSAKWVKGLQFTERDEAGFWELRGPIGGHFIWSTDDGGPVLLVGGGSGVVPLACMLRHRAARSSSAPMTLVASARTIADLIYGDELRALDTRNDGFHFLPTLTRATHAAPGIRLGRIDASLITTALTSLSAPPKVVFVCGTNAFVETAASTLLGLGLPPTVIRTERYGG
jgi:hypothetical protein